MTGFSAACLLKMQKYYNMFRQNIQLLIFFGDFFTKVSEKNPLFFSFQLSILNSITRYNHSSERGTFHGQYAQHSIDYGRPVPG